LKALIRPAGHELRFDTTQESGTDAAGIQHTYADEYEWARVHGAREDLRPVERGAGGLAKQGRIRMILDNAALHHSVKDPRPEDQFEKLFLDAAKAPAEIHRGKFGRYAHDKVFVVSGAGGARKVLTGSTNFSVTGF